jgi:hypothetical protein
MQVKSMLTVLLLCATTASAGDLPADEPLPTSVKLLALVDAAEARIASYATVVEFRTYGILNGKRTDTLLQETRMTVRSNGKKTYARYEEKQYDRPEKGQTFEVTRTFLNGTRFSKSLGESSREKPSGTVQPGRRVEADTAFTPLQAAFGCVETYREWLEDSSSKVSRTEGGFLLESTPHDIPYRVAITVDPARGYTPVHSEMTEGNAPVYEYVCEDFREVAPGVWLPFRFTHETHAPGIPGFDGVYAEFEVKEIEVNIPIAEEDLDLRFPPETHVQNKILATTYELFGGI